MAVMTHARTHPTTANYNTLTVDQQHQFDQVMEEADIAGPATYPTLMTAIALLVGLPYGDIRKCACPCYCPVVFDANDPEAHVIEESGGYNLGRNQCPTCADRHRETA